MTSCAPLLDSAPREFAQGLRQQEPTSRDPLGVYVKAFSRPTCANKSNKGAHLQAQSNENKACACNDKVHNEIILSLSKKLSSRSLTESLLFSPNNAPRAMPIMSLSYTRSTALSVHIARRNG